jgi:hypothetical protein
VKETSTWLESIKRVAWFIVSLCIAFTCVVGLPVWGIAAFARGSDVLGFIIYGAWFLIMFAWIVVEVRHGDGGFIWLD